MKKPLPTVEQFRSRVHPDRMDEATLKHFENLLKLVFESEPHSEVQLDAIADLLIFMARRAGIDDENILMSLGLDGSHAEEHDAIDVAFMKKFADAGIEIDLTAARLRVAERLNKWRRPDERL